ncbi:epidermal growth factor receptor kinase substrate 8-like protein 3b [Latimeria chalumnae]|uniref:epidermal growth factor receptor kinase substrate 8-like protein 3b n=1 Tax=Latimeria chalumnae TaxID=7897 RepID=UPI00313EFB8E
MTEADIIQKEIENVIKEIKEDKEDQDLLRNNLENMLFQHGPGPFMAKPFPMERWSNSDQPVPGMTPPGSQMKKEPAQWSTPDYEDNSRPPSSRLSYGEDRVESPSEESFDEQREIEIMNHLLNDIELFVGKLQKTAPPEKGKKKKKKKKKSSQEKDFPLEAEYIDCLQKTKFTFNQLSKLKNHIQNPSAEELVHVLFSTLIFVLQRSPRSDLAPEIIAPLLTRTTIQFLTFNLTHEEKEVWKSLGDAWNISKSEWQNREPVPQYVPQFSDGWEPPVPSMGRNSPYASQHMREEFQPPIEQAEMQPQSPWPQRAAEKPKVMRAMYDFVGRNSKELSIMKGNILQVLDESRQWWKVKTISGETGYIPNNILEPIEQEPSNEGNSYQNAMFSQYQDRGGPVVLTKNSSKEEVTAWLTQKGFSKITVKCLGVLTGAMLLGMNREEIRQVCPEEAARVFAEIYAVKASSGLSHEGSPDFHRTPYYGH